MEEFSLLGCRKVPSHLNQSLDMHSQDRRNVIGPQRIGLADISSLFSLIKAYSCSVCDEGVPPIHHADASVSFQV